MSPELLNTIIYFGIRIIGAIVVLIITFVVAKWLRKKTFHHLEKSPKTDLTLNKFFSKLVYFAVILFGVLACLQFFGVNIASVVAILAAAAFAVGLAFQGTLSNFAAGIMLLFFRPFKAGDSVSVAGASGTVDEIGLFSTLLDTPDNRRIVAPNSTIYGSTIENNSYHETRRVDVAVGTDYDSDLRKTRDVLEQTAQSIEAGFKDPAPVVYLNELGGSAISWSVRVWTNAADYWSVREELTNELKNALDNANIGMPYPQMDLHVDGKLSGNGLEKENNAKEKL
jgi:small conductance mechanosensitive channel